MKRIRLRDVYVQMTGGTLTVICPRCRMYIATGYRINFADVRAILKYHDCSVS